MFTKGKGPDAPKLSPQPTPPQEAIRSASTKPTARTAPSIISSDMKITGSVASDGEMQIDGQIDGDVSATSLTIGASGQIQGEVKAETIIVRGHIKGAIRARKVELEGGAKVEGDIVHTSLSIQANAVFEGQVKHAEDPLRSSPPQPAAKPATANAASTESPAAKTINGPSPSPNASVS